MLNLIINKHLGRSLAQQRVLTALRMSSSKIHYAKSHEYARMAEGTTKSQIGVSKYAVNTLGDIVYVELPEVGQDYDINDDIGIIESVKASSEVYAPLSGKVVENNEKVDEDYGIVNKDPEGEGWLFTIEMSDASEFDDMMTKEEYDKYCATLD